MTGSARDALATFNERVKLLATSVNTIGLGLIGVAVVRPLTESFSNAGDTIWWLLAGLAMHGLSHYVLRYMRKE
ncbi:hypothetical protein LX81_02333 [Palleronia aestuarii]|uniref:2TM domain-containing protein n=1 Tax=Palleronia aestuarii TaxID=568105 RepID=A0A2W7Q2U1_9RHOB|nr:hypothetical protein [Palleronia aestuarii]PZX16059.1 hypothetical protein LX81_02333 [Palleronia aestuarii]